MRRDKRWWHRLTKGERIELVALESSKGSGGCGYLPDDCSECGYCSTPFAGGGSLCSSCLDRLIALVDKADGANVEKDRSRFPKHHGC